MWRTWASRATFGMKSCMSCRTCGTCLHRSDIMVLRISKHAVSAVISRARHDKNRNKSYVPPTNPLIIGKKTVIMITKNTAFTGPNGARTVVPFGPCLVSTFSKVYINEAKDTDETHRRKLQVSIKGPGPLSFVERLSY